MGVQGWIGYKYISNGCIYMFISTVFWNGYALIYEEEFYLFYK